jgi:hypothetical protein
LTRVTIYVKSLLAGMAAAIVWILLSGIVVVRLMTPQVAPVPAESGSYSSNGRSIPLWPIQIGAVLIFASAGYLTFRRISRTELPQR